MDSNLHLQENVYPRVTPAGAYYAVSSAEDNPSRIFLKGMLTWDAQEPLTPEMLLRLGHATDFDSALNLLFRLQRLEFITGSDIPVIFEKQPLDRRLPELLSELSDIGKAVLAQDTGLYFATAGFHHESAEEIAALAGEVIRMSEKHALLIKNNLSINQNAWAISDPSGQSEMAFIPMYFGDNKLILIVGGRPQLQNDAFVELIQILFRRYGA